jgi:hypothetical protein
MWTPSFRLLDRRHAIHPTDYKIHSMFALYLQYHGLLRQLFSDIGEERSLVEKDGECGG